MAESKTNKSRKKKVENFKEKVKEANQRAAIPKTQLVPQTVFQSTDILEIPGGLVDVMQQALVEAHEALQRAGQAFQQFMAMNIQSEKVKLEYIWNNGEIPTPDEIAKFKEDMMKVQQLRQKQQEELVAQMEKDAKTPKTNLTTVGGQPLTEENLAEENTSRIIV